ncbi:hypothetical protein RDI58_022384 [Solanum bulbocastanum]|uniref:Uncharacterized protein n=1 Tax=Solanum bulbocastanum TaxID=147425 RepID=A0AAN8T1Y3_SOLBU
MIRARLVCSSSEALSPGILLLGPTAGCKLIVVDLVHLSLLGLLLSAYPASTSYYSHNYFAPKMITN